MIRFILNDTLIETNEREGITLVDYIRYYALKKGTKIGCREGDCGACTVLVGEIINGQVSYQTMTSCLMPLINAAGKHILTIEGLNQENLNLAQRSIVQENGTQCGFCTPGFIMSLMGLIISPGPLTIEAGIKAIDGNICRCTGYKSIERAVKNIMDSLSEAGNNRLQLLIEEGEVPSYLADIKKRLATLHGSVIVTPSTEKKILVGGGTDLYVQRSGEMNDTSIRATREESSLRGIEITGKRVILGAGATISELEKSPQLQKIFPGLSKYLKLVSSTPIRNMSTIAGNLVNASPIGDLTIFLLALNSSLVLRQGNNSREIKLKDFYLGYKQLDLQSEEWVEKIFFEVPGSNIEYNFEKVSKRTHLDIASVNSACSMVLEEGYCTTFRMSAGGVAPIPKFLDKTSTFFEEKFIDEQVIAEGIQIMQSEISPISDARGSAKYKRLLIRQLLLAHFEKSSAPKSLISKTLAIC